jgi:hypothetical protein
MAVIGHASLTSYSWRNIHVIFLLGFGRRVALIDDRNIPAGHKLTFQDALRIVATGTPAKIIFPNWMMNLTAGLAKVQLGFDELNVSEQTMIFICNTIDTLRLHHRCTCWRWCRLN